VRLSALQRLELVVGAEERLDRLVTKLRESATAEERKEERNPEDQVGRNPLYVTRVDAAVLGGVAVI